VGRPDRQKVTADAIAVQKHFDGFTAQGGDTGVVQAMIDAKQPFVPFGGETENGFRKFCAKYSADGLKCASGGTGPGAGRGRDQDAIAALEGRGRAAVGQAAARDRRRSPTSRTGDNFYSPTSPTISSSAIPSRPAASTSPPRKSWARPKETNK
jgi:ribose transport system substrate-binding protein